jgi:hypothetical protein
MINQKTPAVGEMHHHYSSNVHAGSNGTSTMGILRKSLQNAKHQFSIEGSKHHFKEP